MSRSIVLLVGALACFGASWLPAQDIVLGQKYGQGVHAFFAGNYVGAYDALTASIDGGTKDPRAFYFRGLAYLKLGRAQEATMDFQKGAALESKDVNKYYNVAKALERVQGKARTDLENYRVEARMAALEETERIRKARYEAIAQEESRVVREQSVSEPNQAANAPKEAPATGEVADPFAIPAADSSEKATLSEKPTAKKSKETKAAAKEDEKDVNPFAFEAKDLDAPKTDASEAAEKATPEATEKAEKPATPAPKKKAEAAEAAPDNDDPFTAAAATEEAKPAAEMKEKAAPATEEKATEEKAPEKKADEKATEKKADEQKADESDPFIAPATTDAEKPAKEEKADEPATK
jgi:hypothetical protein